jgi:hypothetical protein
LPGGGRTEKTAQRLLGKFSKDVFLFRKGKHMTIRGSIRGVRQHLLPLKASSFQEMKKSVGEYQTKAKV